jgi:hypothetical protein
MYAIFGKPAYRTTVDLGYIVEDGIARGFEPEQIFCEAMAQGFTVRSVEAIREARAMWWAKADAFFAKQGAAAAAPRRTFTFIIAGVELATFATSLEEAQRVARIVAADYPALRLVARDLAATHVAPSRGAKVDAIHRSICEMDSPDFVAFAVDDGGKFTTVRAASNGLLYV